MVFDRTMQFCKQCCTANAPKTHPVIFPTLQICQYAGIGAESAKKFASKGYSVALLSRSLDKLAPVEQEISKAGGKALSVPTDAGTFCQLADQERLLDKQVRSCF